MDLRTTSRISSDVLAQFYAVVRITVAVAFFTITREPPTFLVQVEPPLSSVTTALSPCFFILLIPYYLRLATRRALRDAPRYVDEGVCTDVEEEDEQTQVDLSEIDISSDETVIHDVNWNGDDGSNVEKCESCDLVFRDEIAGEAGRDEGDPVEEGPSEGNDEGLLKRSDMTSSDGIIRKVSTIQGDVRNSERLEEVDRAFREEITRAVDLDEMAVGESAKPKHDIAMQSSLDGHEHP
ncbi:hypothetical protein BDV26DRAFT_286191 [Aspergillus bertholletiae]|uniref:Uncharacterized protein n=1 Tax=Aspergillus bertholletiae TaxID=1226010 RepID=A0A5N7AQK1_9EURO|nr:hypothetical protein BDV26DRAFT_286191 [Aspergillus bertholletiae]